MPILVLQNSSLVSSLSGISLDAPQLLQTTTWHSKKLYLINRLPKILLTPRSTRSRSSVHSQQHQRSANSYGLLIWSRAIASRFAVCNIRGLVLTISMQVCWSTTVNGLKNCQRSMNNSFLTIPSTSTIHYSRVCKMSTRHSDKNSSPNSNRLCRVRIQTKTVTYVICVSLLMRQSVYTGHTRRFCNAPLWPKAANES
jgi:hypothetical protein